MFERYTERARRVIFFARYEASNVGNTTIETEHLLLGLLREDSNVTYRFLGVSAKAIHDDITRQMIIREKISTSIDLPLSNECKRILAYAAEEAEQMFHRHIGTEHLLLGMLREERCVAARILFQHGLKLDDARAALARSAAAEPVQHSPVLPRSGVVPDSETAKQIARIVWTPLYGAETIVSQEPLQAELKFNVWIVAGSTVYDDALFAFILQADGRILSTGRGPVTR
jgi:ATP-dependent Clp protease ATP-binding subunit ClpA